MKTQQQLNNPTRAVNLGLKSFASDLKERGVQGVHVPAGAEFKLANLLSKLGNQTRTLLNAVEGTKP